MKVLLGKCPQTKLDVFAIEDEDGWWDIYRGKGQECRLLYVFQTGENIYGYRWVRDETGYVSLNHAQQVWSQYVRLCGVKTFWRQEGF